MVWLMGTHWPTTFFFFMYPTLAQWYCISQGTLRVKEIGGWQQTSARFIHTFLNKHEKAHMSSVKGKLIKCIFKWKWKQMDHICFIHSNNETEWKVKQMAFEIESINFFSFIFLSLSCAWNEKKKNLSCLLVLIVFCPSTSLYFHWISWNLLLFQAYVHMWEPLVFFHWLEVFRGGHQGLHVKSQSKMTILVPNVVPLVWFKEINL